VDEFDTSAALVEREGEDNDKQGTERPKAVLSEVSQSLLPTMPSELIAMTQCRLEYGRICTGFHKRLLHHGDKCSLAHG